MASHFPTHHLEHVQRDLVQVAGQRHQSASFEREAIEKEYQREPSQHCACAYQRALIEEDAARKEYLAALRLLADLVESRRPGQADTVLIALPDHNLTARETEVLRLIASGQSSKTLAHTLGITFRTAVCHRYRIQQKLHAHNTADITRAAIRMGLVEI